MKRLRVIGIFSTLAGIWAALGPVEVITVSQAEPMTFEDNQDRISICGKGRLFAAATAPGRFIGARHLPHGRQHTQSHQ
jgi:hypothetical protein